MIGWLFNLNRLRRNGGVLVDRHPAGIDIDQSVGSRSGYDLGLVGLINLDSPRHGQLRRFIKSRAYVPMHELRRRFTINGDADDVRAVKTRDGRYWAGLPERECGFLAELVDRGEVGVELCHDPCVDMIIGVYAIRPVGR